MIKLILSTFYKEKETKKALMGFIGSAKQLSFGVECKRFEKNFAKFQNRKYCIFFNSGSSANLALFQALLNLGRIKKNESVGFSAVTWSTNVMPIIQIGLNPIPIDIELNTLNISSNKLEELLKKTSLKVLFLTNLLGFCGDLDKIRKTCKEKRIILLEDNCESLGSVYKGENTGNFGLASTFSFYVGHHMSTIEGGAVCTDDKELSVMLKMVRAHGWDRNLEKSDQEEIRRKNKIRHDFYGLYSFYDLGYNLRPNEINGFLGNNQLRYIREINKKRNSNFLKLAKIIYRDNRYYPIKFDHIDFVSNFAFPIICKSENIKNKIIKKCKNIIEIRPIVGGNIIEQIFFKKYNKLTKIPKVPNAEIIQKQGVYFGNNPSLKQKDINKIINVFTKK